MTVLNQKIIDNISKKTLPGLFKIVKAVESKSISLSELGVGSNIYPGNYKSFEVCNCHKLKCNHYYELRRLTWRFRMAQHKSKLYLVESDNIDLDIKFDKKEGTSRAYARLGQYFALYTCLERILEIFNLSLKDFIYEVKYHRLKEISFQLRKLDKNENIITHILRHSRKDSKEFQAKKFIDNNDTFITFYLIELRNMYAHGSLTANPNGLSANKFSLFLEMLNNFLISEIKDFFERKSSECIKS